MENYTQDASAYLEDLVLSDIAEIWADIGLLDGQTDAQKWKAKLQHVARAYLMTSRFALMRLFRDRALRQGLAEDAGRSFRAEVGQRHVVFREITMAHAQDLTPQEHRDYTEYFLELAGPSPEEEPDLHERIICRAWYDEETANALARQTCPDPKERSRLEKENKKRYGPRFTRQEALRLGHILKFSLEEMQWYLLRVFDVDESLRANRAGDLIEAYVFLTGGTCGQAEALRRQYRRPEDTGGEAPLPRRGNWTRQTAGGLLEQVETWKRGPETMDQAFLQWLSTRSPGLDRPSRTALRVYRNLAAYAYAGSLPGEEALLDELLHIADMDDDSEEALEYLFDGGAISPDKCARAAEQLYWENRVMSGAEVKDNTKAWSVITTRPDRVLSASSGALNSSRTRIQSLLLGKEEVEKGDLLYLLWFTFNLVWSDSGTRDHRVLYDRIFDLKDAAGALLEAALLPAFYPPHLMEQSMLLSIVYAGKTGTDPAVVYAAMLQALKTTRDRSAGAQRHTLAEKIDIVTHYRAQRAQPGGLSLKQCALLHGISEKTLSQWQKELTAQGHIPAPAN